MVLTMPRPEHDPRLDDEGLKLAYAARMVRDPEQSYLHAFHVIGPVSYLDNQVAAIASDRWPHDPVVIAERRRLVTEAGPSVRLPTKEDMAELAYSIAKDVGKSVPDRLASLRLSAELAGFISKAGLAVSPVSVNASSVMIVKDKGSEADWSAGCQAQQSKLIADARQDADNSGDRA